MNKIKTCCITAMQSASDRLGTFGTPVNDNHLTTKGRLTIDRATLECKECKLSWIYDDGEWIIPIKKDEYPKLVGEITDETPHSLLPGDTSDL